jgi:D-psicose/D-tagatose/L-ribulose 3-epimerase
MNFGAHAFVWAGEWNEEASRKVINGAADAGLDFVEIGLLRPKEFDAEDTRRKLEAKGLSATFSLGLPADATLPDNPQAAEAFLVEVLDKIEATGNHLLSGVIYGTLGELPGRRPSDADYDTIAASLKRIAREAAKRDIGIGLEPVNRYETFLINTVDQCLDVINRIGEENVFIHLDTYHMNIEEDDFADAIRRAGSKLGYIHLSESHRGTPGSGTVDWDSVFQGLSDIDFRGGLVMESFADINPDIARATCMWRDIVKDPEKLVKDGLAFLRGKAEEYKLK